MIIINENEDENENCFSEWLVLMEYLIENVSDNGLRPMPPARLDIMKMNFLLSILT